MAKRENKIAILTELVMPPEAKQKLFANEDVLFKYIPELLVCRGFNQKNPYHIYNVLGHTLEAVDVAAEDPVVRVALLLHDIGKPIAYQEGPDGIRHFHGHAKISADIAQRVLKRLGADENFNASVVQLVRLHDCFISMDEKAVARLIFKMGPDEFGKLLCVREADIKAQNPEFAGPRLRELIKLKELQQQVYCSNPMLTSAMI